MARDQLAPPAAEDCLIRSRVGKYKGGTLLAEEVVDLDTHLRRVADPDGYRPDACARCLFETLHVHSYPERRLHGEANRPVVRIVQFICAEPSCRATWRILPRFLARHLWRAWWTVGRVVEPEVVQKPREAPAIPARTERRWRERLASAARVLLVLLATSGSATLAAVATSAGLDATRAELVEVHARAVDAAPRMRLAALATLAHRLERGIRLM
jgi:hypothetical protein